MARGLGTWSGRSSLLAACGLVMSCASIAGIDDLAYDLAGEGGGVIASGSTGAPTSSTSSTSTGDTTSGVSSSSSASSSGGSGGAESSSSAGGGETGGGGQGGEPPTGFLPAADRDAYSDLLRDYHSAIWHLDEPEGEDTADDDGDVRDSEGDPITYHASYLAETGSLTHEVPGVFPDQTAVTFSGGARAEVPVDGPYYFPIFYAGNAFTLTFFFKLDAVPEAPITILSCYGESPFEDDRGWRVLLSDELVLELVGSGEVDNRIVERYRFDVPPDGGWHFVLLAQNDDGMVRGYLDTVQQFAEDSSILGYSDTEGLFSMGAAAGEAGAAAVTLDEVAMSFEAMSGDQIDSIRECLMGEGCFAP